MQLRLFLLLILFFTTTSFFWDDEEKQIRQAHQTAETAMHRKDFRGAKKAFEDLLSRLAPASGSKQRLDWTLYVDAALRLASCCEELEEKEEAEKVIEGLIAKNPPAEFLPKIKLLKARLSLTPQSAADAFVDIKQLLAQKPTEIWTGKELTFFHALEGSLNDYYDDLIPKAKRFLLAGFYQEAIQSYTELLNAIKRGAYPRITSEDSLIAKKIRYRLAESYFLAADYEKTLSVCSDNPLSDELDKEMLYLTALCFREKQEYERALDLFENYTQMKGACESEHYLHALFELGYFYYEKGQYGRARSYFDRLKEESGKIGTLSLLYLARMHLSEGKPQEADALLSKIKPLAKGKDPVDYECFYLRGLAAYSLGEYGPAKEYFERSIPEAKYAWKENSHYHLGWCALQLANDSSKNENYRMHLFNVAEKCFKYISSADLKEAALLSLGQLYLLQFHHFGKPDFLQLQEEILLSSFQDFSTEAKVKALLFLAEGAPSYDQKAKLYKEATSEKYKGSESYFQAWYCRGLNDFQEGLKAPAESSPLFEYAAAAFEVAFQGLERADPAQAASILKLEAKANIYKNEPLASLKIIERLLSQYDEAIEEREETIYLRGLLASKLNGACYFNIAEDSLNQVLKSYPEGKHREDALYALGNLYYGSGAYQKAKEAFIELAVQYPQGVKAPEAWYWTAEAASALGEEALSYRKHVYECYPSSEWAPEAYFRAFPYALYVEGDPEALLHLRQFPTFFSGSPFAVAAYFLIGLHENEKRERKLAFQNGLQAFCDYIASPDKTPDANLIFFRYQLMLSLAEEHLQTHTKESLIDCETLLKTLVEEFSEKEHPYSSLLRHERGYHPFHEKGEFNLARCYLKMGRDSSAQKILRLMLAHYEEAGIYSSSYLPKVWQEQGKLAIRCQDYDTALSCLSIAQEYGKSSFSHEQKLTLWLLQSDCYRKKKDYNTAMRLLSKVINTQIASPLRLKAMYLRSELYELKGRPDLAIRQLEAASKKGGEWGERAQSKLKVKYGLE